RPGGAQGDRADQVLRGPGAARRDRPRDPDPRLVGLLERPAPGGDVPARPGRAHLRRPRRGAPPVGRPVPAPRLHAPPRPVLPPAPPGGVCLPRAPTRTRRGAARQKFAALLEEATANL